MALSPHSALMVLLALRAPHYSFSCQRWESVLMTEGFLTQFWNWQGGEMEKELPRWDAMMCARFTHSCPRALERLKAFRQQNRSVKRKKIHDLVPHVGQYRLWLNGLKVKIKYTLTEGSYYFVHHIIIHEVGKIFIHYTLGNKHQVRFLTVSTKKCVSCAKVEFMTEGTYWIALYCASLPNKVLSVSVSMNMLEGSHSHPEISREASD